ncbi:MAG: IS3 family transposase [Aridibacter famidurans]|nr:IS3 family transposase [Aridibacter famidurans]
MRYRFIAEEKAEYPVVVLCRVMNVSRSAFYAWLNREPDVERLRLIFIVIQIFERSRETYGARRVSKALKADGIEAGRTMAGNLMEEARLEVRKKKRYKVTTDSGHALPVAPNLLERKFDIEETDRVWTGDITFLLTREGWAYLAVVLDLASRRVVGWALSTRIDRTLVTDALRSAFRKRLPEEGLLFHSDRGAVAPRSSSKNCSEGAGSRLRCPARATAGTMP